MNRLLLALSLAFVFAFPAPAAETLLSGPAFGAADYFGSPLLAAGQDGYLAVFHSAELESFYAVRLDAAGAPLDERPRLLLSDAPMRFAASLAWQGDHWVLVWENAGDLHYLEISAGGEAGVRHSPWLVGLSAPRLAWNGSSLLLAASEPRGFRYALHVIAIGPAGAVTGDQVVWSSYFLGYDLAAAESQFGLAVGGNGHTLVRLAPQGAPLGSTVLSPPGISSGDVAVAAAGSAFHVAFVRASGGESLHHALVDATGELVAENEIVATGGEIAGIRVDLAGSAGAVAGVWGGPSAAAESGVAYGAYAVDAAGSVVDREMPSAGLLIAALSARGTDAAALAVREGVTSAVVTDLAGLPERVTAAEGTPLTNGPLMQTGLRVASDAGLHFAVWLERSAAGASIRATRVTTLGQPVDAEPLTVRAPADGVRAPEVAGGGGAFAVVWEEGTRVFGRRFASSGAVLDAQPIQLGAGSQPRVIWDGRAFVVVWNGASSAPPGIFSATLGAGGATTPRRLTTAASTTQTAEFHDHPALAWDGSRYLLAFAVRRVTFCGAASCPTATALALLPLDGDRAALGTAVEIDAAPAAPRVASVGPGEFIAAWTDEGIRAASVHANGGAIAITGPHVVFNADGTLVDLLASGGEARVWWNRAGLAAYPGVSLSGLATARLGPGGAPLEPREGVPADWEDVGHVAGSTFLVRASHRDEAPYFGVLRAVGSIFEDASVVPAPPATPAGVTATRRGSSVEVRWNASPGAILYRVEIDPGYGFVASVHSTETLVRLAAAPGSRFRVTAINGGGVSGPSSIASISVPPRRRLVSRGS